MKGHPFFLGVKWELLPEVARPPFMAPVIDEEEEVGQERGEDERAVGFDLRDYLKGLRRREPAVPPSRSSESMEDF